MAMNISNDYLNKSRQGDLSASITKNDVSLWLHVEISLDGGEQYYGLGTKGIPLADKDGAILINSDITNKASGNLLHYFTMTNKGTSRLVDKVTNLVKEGKLFHGDKYVFCDSPFYNPEKKDNNNDKFRVRLVVKINMPDYPKPEDAPNSEEDASIDELF